MAAVDLIDEALVDVDDAEQYINLEAGFDDQRVKKLINGVSIALQNITERKFTPDVVCQDTRLMFDYCATEFQVIQNIICDWTPVTELTTLTIDGTVYTSDVGIDPDTGLLVLSVALSTSKEFCPLIIDYKAGYTAVPEDIKQVVLDTVSFYWKRDFLEYDTEVARAMQGGRPDESFFPMTTRKVIREYTRDRL